MKVFSSRENRRHALLGLLGVTLGFVVLYLAVQQYASFVFDSEELRVWIGQFGPFAPAVFVVVQFLQVILAPIPGQAVALVAGYLFGPVAGTVYSMVGVVAGSAVAFSISKMYGRAAVERLIDERLLAQFDGFIEEVGALGLLVFVAIPGLPDDAVCFLAGLTTFRLRTFLVLIGIGRLPAYILTVYAGGSLASGRLIEAGIALAAIAAFLVLGYLKRDAIKHRIADH